MTENNETQIISMLAEVISEIRGIRKKQDEHGVILKSHDEKFDLLIARTGDIANTVIDHENRIKKVEGNVSELQSGIH